jgi:hypothetical protein
MKNKNLKYMNLIFPAWELDDLEKQVRHNRFNTTEYLAQTWVTEISRYLIAAKVSAVIPELSEREANAIQGAAAHLYGHKAGYSVAMAWTEAVLDFLYRNNLTNLKELTYDQ